MAYQVAKGVSLSNPVTGDLNAGDILKDSQVEGLKKLGSFESLVSRGTIVEVKAESVAKEEVKTESKPEPAKAPAKKEKIDGDKVH